MIKKLPYSRHTIVSQAINSEHLLTVVRVVSAVQSQRQSVAADANYKMELELKEEDNDSIFCKVYYQRVSTIPPSITDRISLFY